MAGSINWRYYKVKVQGSQLNMICGICSLAKKDPIFIKRLQFLEKLFSDWHALEFLRFLWSFSIGSHSFFLNENVIVWFISAIKSFLTPSDHIDFHHEDLFLIWPFMSSNSALIATVTPSNLLLILFFSSFLHFPQH